MSKKISSPNSGRFVPSNDWDWDSGPTSLAFLGGQSNALQRDRANLSPMGREICNYIEAGGAAAGVPVQYMFLAPYVAYPTFAGGYTGSEWVMTDVRDDPNMNTGFGYAMPRKNLNELCALLDVGLDFDSVTAVHQLAPPAYLHQPWQERVLPPPPRKARHLARSLGIWSHNLERAIRTGVYTLTAGLLLTGTGLALGALATTAMAVATVDPIIIGQINLNRPGTRPMHGDPMLYYFLTAWNWEFEVEE